MRVSDSAAWSLQIRRGAAVAALALVLAGCSSGYYAQSIRGHVSLMSQRESVERLIADPATAPELRTRLEIAEHARAFAERRLAVPASGSYAAYVDLGRRYVTMNVVATPEFSLVPQSWCFPVFGCVSYRGYFAEADAVAFAETLESQGLDVALSGSSAYSTLGWFNDPLLNTIIFDAPYQVAGTIFHELAHQLLYVPDDSTFNESYAVAVERAGVRIWLGEVGSPELVAAYETDLRRSEEFLSLVLGARDDLERLYRLPLDEEAMRERKAGVFTALRGDYQRLKASWGGYAGYDGWFDRDLNNAHLATIATYNAFVPAFQRLLADAGGDMAAFHAAVEALSRLPKAERDALLEDLARR